jgi:hypothetical protein
MKDLIPIGKMNMTILIGFYLKVEQLYFQINGDTHLLQVHLTLHIIYTALQLMQIMLLYQQEQMELFKFLLLIVAELMAI